MNKWAKTHQDKCSSRDKMKWATKSIYYSSKKAKNSSPGGQQLELGPENFLWVEAHGKAF